MEISYPIFIKDRDGWMSILNECREIQDKLERVDIEDEEYTAWDANALPLDFYLDKDKIKARVLSKSPQLDEIREAILNYAKLAKPKVPFVHFGSEKDMIELFLAIEKHIKNHSFAQRIKRLFHK
jgi:hypothetical protein